MLFKKVPAAAGCFQYQYTTEKRPCTAGVCRADRRPIRMVVLSDLHIPSLAHIIVSLWIRCGGAGLLLPAHPGGPCGSRTAHLRSGFPLSGGAQPAGGGRAGKIQLRAHRAGQAEPAAGVVQLVGGTENISSVAHCMIRLRFAVKDLNKADQEALKKIPGVLSVTPAA